MIESQTPVLSWENFRSIFKDYFKFDFLALESTVDKLSSKVDTIDWEVIKEWEDLEDIDIYRKLPEIEKINDLIYVVTDASYQKRLGPFKVHSDKLEDFIYSFLDTYGECFFNGDVLIISIKNSCMWVFHHEGITAFIDRI